MPDLETLHKEDEALNAMFKADKEILSDDDKQAYQDLIDEQRTGYQETQAEVRKESGETKDATVRSVGDAALHNPNPTDGFAVHSDDWHTDLK